MACFAAATFFWLATAIYALTYVIVANDHSHEANETKNSLAEAGCSGVGVIFIVDVTWVALMMLRITPAAWDVPRFSNWTWVDENITLPWIVPQLVLVIWFTIYRLIWGPKLKPKSD